MSYCRHCILVLFTALLVLTCGAAKSDAEKQQAEKAYAEVKTLVGSKQFKYIADAAFPFQTNDVIQVSNQLMRQTENANGRFTLTANEDFFTLNNGSAKGNLSFFGELRTANYSDPRDSSIIFENQVENLKVEENDKKQRVNLSFSVRNQTEQFNIRLVAYSEDYATLIINGSNRTVIRYSGKLVPLDPINKGDANPR